MKRCPHHSSYDPAKSEMPGVLSEIWIGIEHVDRWQKWKAKPAEIPCPYCWQLHARYQKARADALQATVDEQRAAIDIWVEVGNRWMEKAQAIQARLTRAARGFAVRMEEEHRYYVYDKVPGWYDTEGGDGWIGPVLIVREEARCLIEQAKEGR